MPSHRSPDVSRPTHRAHWIAAAIAVGAVAITVVSGVAIAHNDSLGQPDPFPSARTTTRALPTPAPIFPTDAVAPSYAMGTESPLSAPRSAPERVTVYMDRPGPTTTHTATQTVTATATATVTETSTATTTQTVIAEPPVIEEEETP